MCLNEFMNQMYILIFLVVATIFAYGQTSSGKTYTMLGTENSPGIIPLSVKHIFDCIQEV